METNTLYPIWDKKYCFLIYLWFFSRSVLKLYSITWFPNWLHIWDFPKISWFHKISLGIHSLVFYNSLNSHDFFKVSFDFQPSNIARNYHEIMTSYNFPHEMLKAWFHVISFDFQIKNILRNHGFIWFLNFPLFLIFSDFQFRNFSRNYGFIWLPIWEFQSFS